VTLAELNGATPEVAQQALLKCCGSRRWVRLMEDRRPYATVADLLRTAEEVTAEMRDKDWLEAFAAHPRIGQHTDSAWSQSEQAAALSASEEVQRRLAERNREYEEKHGFIFIVFASGKPPETILEILDARMNNSRGEEIRNAAAEQKKITNNRLQKLLEL
jgi:OHCU decarboxylase